MKTLSILPGLLIAGLMTIATGAVSAQEQEEHRPSVTVTADASISFDAYELRSNPPGSSPARRPSRLLRLMVNPTIWFGDILSVPLNIIYTVPETTTLQPQPTSGGGLGDILRNPANSFGISPTFGWAMIDLGTHTPQLSELSGGDIQLFGAGMTLTPGKFRIVAHAGTVGRSVAADTAAGTRGEYGRQAYMGKVAYVNDRTEIGVNVVRIRDDASSIPALFSPLTLHPDPDNAALTETVEIRNGLVPLPEESLTATFNARVPIAGAVLVNAEIGGSIFTRDLNADVLAAPSEAIAPLIDQRTSTRADLAGKFGIDMQMERWGMALNSTYIGAGYRTLAYPWMQADRLDITFVPHVSLLDNDLSVAGSVGWRQNNLSGTEQATTSQLLGSANVDARIGETFAINAQYSNFGIRTPVQNDTLRVETVSQSMSLSPSITLASEAMIQVISASVGIDDYTDYNTINGASGSNHTRSMMGIYSASLAGIPLTFDLSGSWLLNTLGMGDLTITSASMGAGYRLFEEELAFGINGSLTRTRLDGAADDEGITLRLTGTWNITPSLRLRGDISGTSYRYGDVHPGASFRENLIRTSLEWQW